MHISLIPPVDPGIRGTANSAFTLPVLVGELNQLGGRLNNDFSTAPSSPSLKRLHRN